MYEEQQNTHMCTKRVTMIISYNILKILTRGNMALEHSKKALKLQQSAPCFHAKKSKAALLTEPHCVAALKGFARRPCICTCVCVSVHLLEKSF